MSQWHNNLISQIASYLNLDAAYAWLRAKRLESHPNNPFWSLSRNWPSIRARLRTQLQAGTYHLSPVTQLPLQNGETVSYWDPLESHSAESHGDCTHTAFNA